MSRINVLIINVAGHIVGDTAMLLTSLSCLDSDQYSIHVVSTPRGAVYDQLLKLPNVQIYPMELGGKETDFKKHSKWRRVRSLIAVARIAVLAKHKKIDLIYTIDRTVAMAISYFVSRLTGCPLALSAHISFYLKYSRIHRMVINHARSISVVSENMRREFLPYASDPEKIIVLPNAVHLQQFDPNTDGKKIRRELNLDHSIPVITLIGRIDPWKGQAEIIEAASSVLQKHPETVFLLIGKGDPEYVESLKTQVKDLQLEHKILFLGQRNDVHNILAAADISTMPSHYEAFGLVALEAMAMAKPVVATKAGGVPEFVVEGEMGLLVPPGDAQALAQALIHLLDNPEKAKRMGSLGRQQVERYYSFRQYQERFSNFLYRVASGLSGVPLILAILQFASEDHLPPILP